MSSIIITILVLAIIGLLVGLLLVFAGDTFKVDVDPKESAVRELLPGNNCGACGYAGCDALAAAIAKGEAPVNACLVGGVPVADKISSVMGVAAAAPREKRVAFVRCAGTCDAVIPKCNYIGIETCEAAATLPGKGIRACMYGCIGNGSCVKVCQFDAIHVENGVAVVNRQKCVACGKCVAICPHHLIEIVPDSAPIAVQCSSRDKGQLVRQSCSAGCIGCGLCVRQCESSAITVVNNIAHINYDRCIGCGKCMAKCPAKIIRVRNGKAVIAEKAES